jgi:hypothetical protein
VSHPAGQCRLEMKIKKQEITTEDILEHWRLGKSTLDWRPLTTIKEKREWLKACLFWTGLPDKKIESFNYIIDGNQVNSEWDFYCLMGETFFGYRGYFGQDSHGLMDCFSEIFMQTKDNETVKNGAKIIVKNSGQVREVLQDDFQYIVESLRDRGFDIELD